MHVNKPKIQENLHQCPACEGDGKFYTDDPDAIEGYKLSRSMACPMCGGKKVFLADDMMGKAVEAYWTTLNKLRYEKYEREMAELNAEEETFNNAMRKLTFNEVEVIKKRLK